MVIARVLAAISLAALLGGCAWLDSVWRDPPIVVRGSYGPSSGLQGEVGVKF